MNKDFNVYKWRREQLIENETTPFVKKIKDLTLNDVADLNLPTGESGGVMNTMRDEGSLENWKEKIIKLFPNALEMEIRIDKTNPTWFNRATIIDPEFIKTMKEKEAAFQAMYDKDRGRYQGD